MLEESGPILGLEVVGHRKDLVRGEDNLRPVFPWLFSFLKTGPSGEALDADHPPDNRGQHAPVFDNENKPRLSTVHLDRRWFFPVGVGTERPVVPPLETRPD